VSRVVPVEVAVSEVVASEVVASEVVALPVSVSGVCDGPPPPHATTRSAPNTAPSALRERVEFMVGADHGGGSDGKAEAAAGGATSM
jgi:hypothetical protein